MSEFLVELYVPKTSWDAVAGASERLRRSTAELTAEGRPVELVRSIFVPEDETCFLLMEAASVDVVREAARRAAVSYERVAETALDLRSD